MQQRMISRRMVWICNAIFLMVVIVQCTHQIPPKNGHRDTQSGTSTHEGSSANSIPQNKSTARVTDQPSIDPATGEFKADGFTLLLYSFNEEGLTIVDQSRNGNYGNVSQPFPYVQGPFDKAISFTGKNYISIDNTTLMNFCETYTLEFWIFIPEHNPGHIPSIMSLVNKDSGTRNPTFNLAFFINTKEPNGELAFVTTDTTNIHTTVYSNYKFKSFWNQWHYIAATLHQKKMKLYIDGKLVGEEICEKPLLQTNKYPIYLGQMHMLDRELLHMDLDNLRISSVERSSKAIQAAWEAGKKAVDALPPK